MNGRAASLHLPDASRPAMLISLWLDRHLLGGSSLAHHAVSLLLHVLASLLAYFLSFAILRRRAPAFVAGLLFALAPVHAEAVVAINYREDLLAAIGGFGALLLFLWPVRGQFGALRAFTLASLLILALGAKENALVVVPLGLLLLPLVHPAPGSWRRREPAYVAGVSALILWGGWRWSLHLIGDGIPRAPGASLSERLLSTLDFEAWSLATELWPSTSRVIHHFRPAPLALAFAGLSLFALGAFWMGRRHPREGWTSAALLAVVAPLLTSPLVGPINERADRYVYIGVLGGAMLWALVFERIRRRVSWPAAGALLLFASLLIGGRAHLEAAAFRDDVSLFGRAVTRAPHSPRAHRNLSWALRKAGDAEGALAAAEEALALDPSDGAAAVTLAMAELALGDVESALEGWEELRSRPGPPAHGLDVLRRCLEEPREGAVRCAVSGPPTGGSR